MSRVAEIQAWYQALQPRERLLVAAGAAFLLVMLIYASLLHPYLASRKDLQSHVDFQQNQLASMRSLAVQLESLRGQQPSGLPMGQSLLAVVSRSAADAGFGAALKQVQTGSDGVVHVQLQAVAFDSLMRWLGDLHRQYGVSVKDMTAQRASGPGSVDASLSLEAPGA
jgi:general secretion pathway protein M